MTIQELYRERLAGKYPTGTSGHLKFLHDLILRMNAQQVIEIGVHTGGSTTAFLTALEQIGGKLWSCDKNPPQLPISEFVGMANWEFVQASDVNALGIAPSQCDILLCDATFSHERLLWQLQNYGARVRKGGIILVHDSNGEMVKYALEQYGSQYEQHNHSYGLAVIQK